MKQYLSFGGGVNSTALMLWLMDKGVEFEAVYADHGADWPETKEYVEMLISKGYPITILETRRNDLNLYDYYFQHRMVPMRVARACTRLYKLVPLARYMATPCVVHLGISADESQRVDRIVAGQREGEDKQFPLVDEGITRQGCIEIIQARGLEVPIKSGCFICPFQRRSQWSNLRTLHPDLFCKAKALEEVTNQRLAQRVGIEQFIWETACDIDRNAVPKPVFRPIYLAGGDQPLEMVANAQQMDLFGERDFDRPCLCEL